MMIIVICLLIEKKYQNLKLTIKMLTFRLDFFKKVYLMDLVLLSLEKYLLMQICMAFQSTTILLINIPNLIDLNLVGLKYYQKKP